MVGQAKPFSQCGQEKEGWDKNQAFEDRKAKLVMIYSQLDLCKPNVHTAGYDSERVTEYMYISFKTEML